MKRFLFIIAACVCLLSCGTQSKLSGPSSEVVVGQVLPGWQEGYFDIHFINGGRGESSFLIYPDGTTMLIDCAGAPPMDTMDPPGLDPKPSADVTSSEVILNYVKHFMPAVSAGRVDYFVLTHYHSDHMGFYHPLNPVHHDAQFQYVGLGELGVKLPFGKIVDRGEFDDRPSADYYAPTTPLNYQSYLNYVAWASKKYGSTREKFAVGHDDQFPLRHSQKYDFSIRNIAANGDVWTGVGYESHSELPSSAELFRLSENGAKKDVLPGGNVLSCVLEFNYGKFNYFTGGDIQYSGRTSYSYKDIEEPISKVVGEVDVMKASHHGTSNTNSSTILGKLKPSVLLVGNWRTVQPNHETMQRVLEANPDCQIFVTNKANEQKLSKINFAAVGGHFVVRVAPGGGSYMVYSLDDNDMEYKVKAVFGPFVTK
ncbi:MAG: hypothetical protein MJY83_01140 [Bacteroidales bacterium]|nr:hypothetical protein [Bacteroidales bacterium]